MIVEHFSFRASLYQAERTNATAYERHRASLGVVTQMRRDRNEEQGTRLCLLYQRAIYDHGNGHQRCAELEDFGPLSVCQTCQLIRARRVKPAFESQTRLTRAVAENPPEMADC